MILDQKTKSLVDSLLLKNASFVVDESIPFAGYQIVDRIVDALAKRLVSFSQSGEFKVACWAYIKYRYRGTTSFR